jgi:hypothetical protein
VEREMSQQSRDPYLIEEAHCQLTFHPHWPLHVDRGPDNGSVSQNVPGTANGVIFLHYGRECTTAKYVGAWEEKYGSLASVEKDEDILRNGLHGRYIRLSLDSMVTEKAMVSVEGGKGIAPEPEVTPAQILVCIGYTIREVPVLVGYLFRENTDEDYFREADQIMNSLKPVN